MHQCIDGAGGEYAKRQPRQKLRDQDGLGREHQVVVQPPLGVQGLQLHGAGVGHFAARAAGGGDGVHVENPGGLLRAGEVKEGRGLPGGGVEREHFRRVHHRAAADGHDALHPLGQVRPDGVHHGRGGLALAVGLQKGHAAGEVQGLQIFLIQELVGEDEVPRPQVLALRELPKGVGEDQVCVHLEFQHLTFLLMFLY